jgi:hypothetical protein
MENRNGRLGGREVVIVEAVRTPVGRGHPEKGHDNWETSMIGIPAIGFVDIDNDLFYEPNTSTLFADGRAVASEVAAEIEQL